MNLKSFAAVFLITALPVLAQETASLGVLEEKVQKLRADVEDLQFRQQKTEQQFEIIRAELKDLRAAGGGASAEQFKALEARIAAVDAARQKDKQAIIDQLAKELAGLGGGKTIKPTPANEGREHIVQKNETLTSIARACGVTVADLKKANNLGSDALQVGQKLVIPR